MDGAGGEGIQGKPGDKFVSVKILASVRDGGEALLALSAGVDVIDLKEPNHGALGAVSVEAVQAVVELRNRGNRGTGNPGNRGTSRNRGIRNRGAQYQFPGDLQEKAQEELIREIGIVSPYFPDFGRGRVLVSATIGDMDLSPAPVLAACRRWAECGVDVIKIGLFPGDLNATLKALAPLIETGAKVVAVAFADRPVMWQQILPPVAKAGLFGLMLDTADKSRGGLLSHLPVPVLAAFVAAVRDSGLTCGLAGSLRLEDIPVLAPLGPDFLGFRSALCDQGRMGKLSESKLQAVVTAVRECSR